LLRCRQQVPTETRLRLQPEPRQRPNKQP
jgi:hypothetical protein